MILARAAAGLALATVVAGCGAGGGAGASHRHAPRSMASSTTTSSATASPTTASSTASSTAPAPQLHVVTGAVGLTAVEHDIAQLYRDHPAVAAYSTQDVSYSESSRRRVLRTCAGRGAPDTQQVETARVLACAPLVFFYYRYGRVKGVPEATGVADSIYSYVATQIHGPGDARTLLDGVLRGWGLPVRDGGAAPGAAASPAASPAATALVAAIRRSIEARRSVTTTIAGFRAGDSRERIVSEAGRSGAAETLTAGPARAEIRTVHGDAYVRGDRVGLRRLIGLPAAVAASHAGRWLRAPASSAAARSLATENSLAALAPSILPGTADSVHVSAGHRGSARVRVLRWTAVASTGARILATLAVRAGPDPLPLSETTASAADRQVARFTRWDRPVSVSAPRHATELPGNAGR